LKSLEKLSPWPLGSGTPCRTKSGTFTLRS
jgi:hypothetical protein